MTNQPQEIRKTWAHALAVWWAMMWRFCFWVLLLEGVFMLLLDMVIPYDIELQIVLENYSIALLGVVVGVYVTHVVLNRNYGRFRVSLVEPQRQEGKLGWFFAPVYWLTGKAQAAEQEDAAAPQQDDDKKTYKKSEK